MLALVREVSLYLENPVMRDMSVMILEGVKINVKEKDIAENIGREKANFIINLQSNLERVLNHRK